MTLTAKGKDGARVVTATSAATFAIKAKGKAEQAAHSAIAMADATKAEKEADKSGLVKADASQVEEGCAKHAPVQAKAKEGYAISASENAKAKAQARSQARAQARAAKPRPDRPNAEAAQARAEANAKTNTQAKAQAEAKTQAAEARAAREAEDLRLDKLEAHCTAVDAELDTLKDEAAEMKRRAEQEEHWESVMRTARRTEIREVGHHADIVRVICNRAAGQHAKERKKRARRKERLDKVLELEKARADRAELSLRLIRECLEKEKVGFVFCLTKYLKLFVLR